MSKRRREGGLGEAPGFEKAFRGKKKLPKKRNRSGRFSINVGRKAAAGKKKAKKSAHLGRTKKHHWRGG